MCEVIDMKTTIVVVIAMLLAATLVSAQDVTTSLYCQKGYTGIGIGVAGKDGSVYYERSTDGYDVLIAKANVGDIKIVLRQDDNIWTRLGAQFNVGGGKSKITVLALPGLGDAPTWVDVFTPAVAVAKNVVVSGHARLKEGGNNDWWLGPTYGNGRFDAYYHYNFREGGSYEGGVDYQIKW